MESLNYQDRPPAVALAIETTFARIATKSDPSDNWVCTGNGKCTASGYSINGVNEYCLMEHIINTTSQTAYTILDIGSGASCWAMTMAHFINKLPKPPLRVTIISLTGEKEQTTDKPDTTVGKCSLKETTLGSCTLMTFYAFKIENMLAEFHAFNLLSHLQNNVDLIISRCAFIHFVDRYGTFHQACLLSKPATGYFLLGNLSSSSSPDDWNYTLPLLLDLQLRFISFQRRSYESRTFLMQRPDDQLYPIFFHYTGTLTKDPESHTILRATLERTVSIPLSAKAINGDLTLYKTLREIPGLITIELN